jgi:hypothetical protein
LKPTVRPNNRKWWIHAAAQVAPVARSLRSSTSRNRKLLNLWRPTVKWSSRWSIWQATISRTYGKVNRVRESRRFENHRFENHKSPSRGQGALGRESRVLAILYPVAINEVAGKRKLRSLQRVVQRSPQQVGRVPNLRSPVGTLWISTV